jgi:hypothetical protein
MIKEIKVFEHIIIFFLYNKYQEKCENQDNINKPTKLFFQRTLKMTPLFIQLTGVLAVPFWVRNRPLGYYIYPL